MISLRIGGIIVAAFIAGAFLASPELRAYAAATIGSADIIDESIQSVDIKNGQVKAADIATDAVGAAEIAGVSKLLFAQCKSDAAEGDSSVPSGSEISVHCDIAGVDEDDSVSATLNGGAGCFEINRAAVSSDGSWVNVIVHNDCPFTTKLGAGVPFAIMVFDK